jgi:secondary thiamine-phosphate synthase enzyme
MNISIIGEALFMIVQQQLFVQTHRRGTTNISQQVTDVIASASIGYGLCHVFVHHTSASLMLCENADPTVRKDLDKFMQRLAPDGDPLFDHVDEGPDDMPAHVRTVITHTDLTIPVSRETSVLGTWQGIYLWEHRTSGFRRQLTVTVMGENQLG